MQVTLLVKASYFKIKLSTCVKHEYHESTNSEVIKRIARNARSVDWKKWERLPYVKGARPKLPCILKSHKMKSRLHTETTLFMKATEYFPDGRYRNSVGPKNLTWNIIEIYSFLLLLQAFITIENVYITNPQVHFSCLLSIYY